MPRKTGSNKRFARDEHWRRTKLLIARIAVVWFFISFVCGILFVDLLNHIQIAGFKLGFWFAQQGSIYGFIAIIFYYVRAMHRLDREFDIDGEDS